MQIFSLSYSGKKNQVFLGDLSKKNFMFWPGGLHIDSKSNILLETFNSIEMY